MKLITLSSNQNISGFDTLLRYLQTRTLILTGIAGNFCVLFTANDAYMRDFNLFVPSDCTVSNTKRENDGALRLMKKFLKADTRLASGIVLLSRGVPRFAKASLKNAGRKSSAKAIQRCW